MESSQQTTGQNLFELQVDHETTSYLSETAKWAKFLSIVGFVMCGLLLLAALFAGTLMSTISRIGGSGAYESGLMAGSGILIGAIYVAVGALYFLPCLYLYRFATKMQVALRQNDQVNLNRSLGSLKSCFKFVGVLTLIVLALYALIIVGAIIVGLVAANR